MIVLSHDCHAIVIQHDRHVVVSHDSHVINLSHDSHIVILSCVGNLRWWHLCWMQCTLHCDFCIHIGHLFSHLRCLPFTLKEPASLSALLRPVRSTRKPSMSFLTTKPGKNLSWLWNCSSPPCSSQSHTFIFLFFSPPLCQRNVSAVRPTGDEAGGDW